MSEIHLLAHGIGGRSDLPLPLSLVAYSAGAVLVLSFAALAWLWPRPRWEREVEGKLVAPALTNALGAIGWVMRIASFALLVIVLVAAFTGPDDPQRNIASSTLYVVWWVGFLLAVGLVGDLWRAIGPVSLLAKLLAKERRTYRFGHWPAAIGLLAFTWLELVHPSAASPRIVGVALTIYLIATIAGLVLWGRGWATQGDPFGALFALVATIAPFYVDAQGRLRIRPPLAGAAAVRTRPGTVALVCTALGSTTFDGLARTQLWTGLVGDGGVVINTIGLVWTIGAVYALYRLAISAMPILAGVPADERDPDEASAAFIHSLIPIALAYAVAHYFSLLVFEGQTFLALLSDPLSKGWNLFGTADWTISYSAASPNTIAYVQVGAVVLGHVAGVILAHDRAVSRYPLKVATKTQYPMLAAMVVYTVGALLILLGG